MGNSTSIRINPRLTIPLSELALKATRSGGPGGQHVNTSATRIQLAWDVRRSPSLSERRRALLLERLATRLDRQGVLRLAADTHRSQHRNRQAVLDRFAAVVAEALRVPKARKPTKPSRVSKEERLRRKKLRSRTKDLRGRVRDE